MVAGVRRDKSFLELLDLEVCREGGDEETVGYHSARARKRMVLRNWRGSRLTKRIPSLPVITAVS